MNTETTGTELGQQAPVPVIDDERASLLAQLQDLHTAAKAEHHLDLAVPGYRNLLWARFVPFSIEKTEAKIKEFQKAKGKPVLLGAACDTLIEACQQLMLLKPEFGGGTAEADIGEGGVNLMPIDETAVPPIAFDSRIEGLFNIDNPTRTARGVVMGMFSTEQAILAMNIRVGQWMQDVTAEVDDDLMGNF